MFSYDGVPPGFQCRRILNLFQTAHMKKQRNAEGVIFFLLIHSDDSPFTKPIKSDNDWCGLKPKNMCMWSGLLLIDNNLWLWFWTIPVIYCCKRSFHEDSITAFRNFTANTHWICICVYVFAINFLNQDTPGWVLSLCGKYHLILIFFCHLMRQWRKIILIWIISFRFIIYCGFKV